TLPLGRTESVPRTVTAPPVVSGLRAIAVARRVALRRMGALLARVLVAAIPAGPVAGPWRITVPGQRTRRAIPVARTAALGRAVAGPVPVLVARRVPADLRAMTGRIPLRRCVLPVALRPVAAAPLRSWHAPVLGRAVVRCGLILAGRRPLIMP